MSSFDSYVRLKYNTSLDAAKDWAKHNNIYKTPKNERNRKEMEAINKWWLEDHPEQKRGPV